MEKANCRTVNQCIFCKYWLGASPKTNYRTGESHYDIKPGLCSKRNIHCNPDHICEFFHKSLLYM